MPDGYEELAAYVVDGSVRVDECTFSSGTMAVFRDGSVPRIAVSEESRVMIVGGANLGKRHIWWNFVSTSKARIEQAKTDWQEGRFGKVEGDDEFIPLP